MGQVITEHRTDDTPGPGTRGGRRTDEGQQVEGRGPGWRLLAVVLGIALAVTLGWVLGARQQDTGSVTSASDEAAALAGEKDAILAGGLVVPVAPVTVDQEAATHRQEKQQLVATGEATVTSTVTDQATLHDEKVVATSRWTGPAAPEATAPLTERDEKELLLAG